MAQKNEIDVLNSVEKQYDKIIGKLDNINGNENKKMIENKEFSYDNPVIPVGFKTSNEGASWSVVNEIVEGWNDGLVIEDKIGNQFVWVPVYEESVNGKSVPYKKFDSTNTYTPISDTIDDENALPTGVLDEANQIKKYHGFYIARYEAGIPEDMTEAIASLNKRNVEGTPISKKNACPWNMNLYDNALKNAKKMYNSNFVKSGLITGTQWDTTLKWIENAGYNVSQNSKSWGNYKNSEIKGITHYYESDDVTLVEANIKPAGESYILPCGHSEYTKTKNIYDLAGNNWEWTSEFAWIESQRVPRGIGHNSDNPTNAGFRGCSSDPAAFCYRCVLYIL